MSLTIQQEIELHQHLKEGGEIIVGLNAEVIRLRELLRDCPLLTCDPSSAIYGSLCGKWIELAKEEVLKL